MQIQGREYSTPTMKGKIKDQQQQYASECKNKNSRMLLLGCKLVELNENHLVLPR